MTSAFDLETEGGERRPLILQVERGRGPGQGTTRTERDLLDAAGAAGVPVPRVVAMGEDDDIGPAWLVVERLDGETIPRKLLRDAAWATARGRAHRPVRARPGRHPRHRPRRRGGPAPDRPAARSPAPARCVGRGAPRPRARGALARRAPARARCPVTVHGDFRCGNLLVDAAGLRGVLDWELAHGGDPAEDIGWLCAPAWRFGGPGRGGRLRPARRAARRLRRRRRWHRHRAGACTGGRSTPRSSGPPSARCRRPPTWAG